MLGSAGGDHIADPALVQPGSTAVLRRHRRTPTPVHARAVRRRGRDHPAAARDATTARATSRARDPEGKRLELRHLSRGAALPADARRAPTRRARISAHE